MTKLTYKLFLFLIIGFCTSLHASEPIFKKEFTREVHETFNVSSGVNLGIKNKYGNISITTWDKNQIQIDVLIKVKSSNSEKAQKFLDAIEIDFESSSSKVIAKTVYPDLNNNNSWWSSWFGNNKNIDYEVHYTINAPVDMNTKLVNKYGNISQNSIDGDSEVTNKYGNITLEDISGELTLNLGYGKAKVGKAGSSKVQIKYSSLKLVSAEDLDISTKYSDIKIKTCDNMVSQTKYDDYTIEYVGSLENNGKYDEFNIGTINSINIDTKYSDLNINTLNIKGVFDTGYGSVDVQTTGSNLKKISIYSKYTDYEFEVLGDFHLDFEGSHTDLHVNKPFEKYNSNKDGSDLRIKAFRGSKDGGVQIIADMRYGGLDID